MSNKSRLYLYVAAGVYLAYNGIGLVRSAVTERPDNFVLYLGIGVIFVVLGGSFAIRSIRKLSKGNDDDKTEGEE